MAYARRKDSTHREVIQAFEACGWAVCDVSRAPYCPDLFVSRKGRTVAVEVKTGTAKRKAHQVEFAKHWAGDYALITSADDVLALDVQESS